MLHIFRVFSTNITAAVLDNLSSNQVVFGWQGVLATTVSTSKHQIDQVVHFGALVAGINTQI